MKEKTFNICLLCAIILFFSTVCAFSINNALEFQQESQTRTAIVNQIEGLYIYILCTPVNEFQIIGSDEKHFVLSGNPSELIKSFIKRTKKDYPNANGIIFSTYNLDKCQIIKFKN